MNRFFLFVTLVGTSSFALNEEELFNETMKGQGATPRIVKIFHEKRLDFRSDLQGFYAGSALSFREELFGLLTIRGDASNQRVLTTTSGSFNIRAKANSPLTADEL